MIVRRMIHGVLSTGGHPRNILSRQTRPTRGSKLIPLCPTQRDEGTRGERTSTLSGEIYRAAPGFVKQSTADSLKNQILRGRGFLLRSSSAELDFQISDCRPYVARLPYPKPVNALRRGCADISSDLSLMNSPEWGRDEPKPNAKRTPL